MRLIDSIHKDIRAIKQAIREAMQCGDEREAAILYEDLDELLEELHKPPLLNIYFDKHIGVGIRWARVYGMTLISFSIPFITLQINLGTYRED